MEGGEKEHTLSRESVEAGSRFIPTHRNIYRTEVADGNLRIGKVM